MLRLQHYTVDLLAASRVLKAKLVSEKFKTHRQMYTRASGIVLLRATSVSCQDVRYRLACGDIGIFQIF
jgi:hypothetical protein